MEIVVGLLGWLVTVVIAYIQGRRFEKHRLCKEKWLDRYDRDYTAVRQMLNRIVELSWMERYSSQHQNVHDVVLMTTMKDWNDLINQLSAPENQGLQRDLRVFFIDSTTSGKLWNAKGYSRIREILTTAEDEMAIHLGLRR